MRHNPSCLLATLVLTVVLSVRFCQGQELDPRRWSHLPIGANFGGIAYGYTTGDIFLEPELNIRDAQFDLQTVGVKYIRSFELLGKSARIDLTQPYQDGHWEGLLNGVPAKVERDGLANPTVRFAVNLFGAPPLAGKEFAEYRAKTDCETIVGAGLGLQVPTGEYYDDKMINLGDNRFTFRPQIGVVQGCGKWSVELTTMLWIYTDNDDFFHDKRLEQEPLYTVDANLVYTFRPGLWLAGGAGYGYGGETSVNGVQNDNRKSTLGGGVVLGIPINRAVGVKFGYIGTRTQTQTGLDSDTFTSAVSVMW